MNDLSMRLTRATTSESDIELVRVFMEKWCRASLVPADDEAMETERALLRVRTMRPILARWIASLCTFDATAARVLFARLGILEPSSRLLASEPLATEIRSTLGPADLAHFGGAAWVKFRGAVNRIRPDLALTERDRDVWMSGFRSLPLALGPIFWRDLGDGALLALASELGLSALGDAKALPNEMTYP